MSTPNTISLVLIVINVTIAVWAGLIARRVRRTVATLNRRPRLELCNRTVAATAHGVAYCTRTRNHFGDHAVPPQALQLIGYTPPPF